MIETGKEYGRVLDTLNSIERHGNIVTIEKPEGKYSIAYGMHGNERRENIPSGVDGVCFEWPAKYPSTNEEVKKRGIGNQKPFFDYAHRNRIPLLATDCSVRPAVDQVERFADAFEVVLAGELSLKTYKAAAREAMTRRKFLKTMLFGGAAFYFLLPLISSLGRGMSSLTGIGEEQTVGLSKFTQKIHPEDLIVTLGLRDTVAAQKIQFLLREYGYKHLLAPRGARHVGLETAILAEENERINYLRRLKPIFSIALSDPKTLYQIYEYRLSSSGNWKVAQIMEEPRLKQLAARI